MLWACLHFFDLPLHAAFAADERALPCALTAGPRQRPHIVMANAAARRLGVRLAQPLAAARAGTAQLLARARDEAAEQRLLRSLAAWAYRFSSHVSLDGEAALLVEVGASLRLFGGWPALERRLRDDLQAIGYAPRIAVAPVAGAARVLARSHGFFADTNAAMLAALGNVPIADSGLAANAIALLGSVGLRTLREVFALPPPELARRVGLPALEALDRMRGLVTAPLLLYRPAERFDHRVEFEARISSWPPLLFPLRRLCEELSLFLAARDGGVQRCTLVLEHEDQRAPTRIAIELLTPQREARTLYDLIRSRLERATLAAPACAIALVARDLPALRPRHADLFETRRTQALAWPDLAERLRSKLGDESVHRLAPAADHRPEFAWRFEADRASPPPANARPARAKAKPRARPRAGKSVAAAAAASTSSPSAPASIFATTAAVTTVAHLAPSPSPSPALASTSASASATTSIPASAPVFAPASDFALAPALASAPAPAPVFAPASDFALAPVVASAFSAPALAPKVAPAPVLAPASISATTYAPEPATAPVFAPASDFALAPALASAPALAPRVSPAPAPTSAPGSAPASVPPSAPLSAAPAATAPASSLVGASRATQHADAGSTRAPRLRPLWLLRRAQPLAGIAEVLAGPERIESGWWDGVDVRRDYYVVRLDSGQRAWAFHATGGDGGWMLHGWFA